MDRAAASGVLVSIRPFGTLARERIAGDSARRRIVALAPTWITVWNNSDWAWSETEGSGPVWAGRGNTVAASTGFEGKLGPLSYAARPIGFWAENLPYAIYDSSGAGPNDFAFPWLAGQIDLPFRFGAASYGRVDAGESFIRLEHRWAAIGVSTQAQTWGPARLHPVGLSGLSAGGFPHAYIETGLPVPIWIGKFSARWMAGRIPASSFGVKHAGTSERALVGAVGVFTPRGMPGLEIGALRLFHAYNSSIAFDKTSLLQPFEEVFKSKLSPTLSDPRRESNQLASAFIRVAPPGSRVEVYGEFMRDDHNVDARDLAAEVDHDATYVVGVRWRAAPNDHENAVIIENVNSRFTHVARVREQALPYTHTRIIEGHTLRGLPLGSPLAVGGGGLQVRIDRRIAGQHWTADLAMIRLAQDAEGGRFRGMLTGMYDLGLSRTADWRGQRWSTGVHYQPAYGHARGANLQMRMSISRGER